MTDETELTQAAQTETTVRQFDAEGRVIAETVTVVTQWKRADDEPPTGMYL